jgi:hypothetical protein
MGIPQPLFDFEHETLETLNIQYSGLQICELGNQRFALDIPISSPVAKKYYEKQGAKHTSLDLNGKDGALKLDLDYPIPADMVEKFDLLTNYGTLEHVNNQYQSFKNMHDLTKIGGCMIHALPLVNNWPNHCRYHYPETFSTALAQANEYKVLSAKVRSNFYDKRDGEDKNLILVSFIKTKHDFMSETEFSRLPIVDSGNTVKTGDYDEESALVFSMKNKAHSVLVKHPRARSLVHKVLGRSD